jgi:hypothetical protein
VILRSRTLNDFIRDKQVAAGQVMAILAIACFRKELVVWDQNDMGRGKAKPPNPHCGDRG